MLIFFFGRIEDSVPYEKEGPLVQHPADKFRSVVATGTLGSTAGAPHPSAFISESQTIASRRPEKSHSTWIKHGG